MGQSSPKFGQLSPKSGQLSAGERLAAYLRRVHPVKTPEAVETATDGAVSADLVRKILARQSAPSFTTFAALILAYGPDLLAATLPDCPRWLDRVQRAERRASLQAEIERLEAELDRGAP